MCAAIPHGFYLPMRVNICGVQVRVGFLFAFSVCFVLTTAEDAVVRMAVIFSLLHECGHLLADFLFGCKPRAVSLGLFGMTITRAEDLSLSYRQEICSALAGPAVNLIFAAVCGLLYLLLHTPALLTAAGVNLSIFVFNAMPVFSLDGGKALEAFLRIHVSDVHCQIAIQKTVSLLFIAVCMGYGFYVLIQSEGNFSLLLLCVYLIVVLFLKCGE